MQKPYAESCDQNKDPILSIIKPLLNHKHDVLEIGSGTGQHAVYFARHMPHLVWQPSDQNQYLHGINLWRIESGLDNIAEPVELDVSGQWPSYKYDAIFSANTLHIMSWCDVKAFFSGINSVLNSEGLLFIYGPFNYNQKYTSESNAQFDSWLKARDPNSGIRDFDEVNCLAREQGLRLYNDYKMPANNRILCWEME